MIPHYEPPEDFPVADAIEAYRTVVAFWRALAADDDATVRELLVPATMIRNGLTPDGLAAQLRERAKVTIDECQRMATSARLRVLEDGFWAFVSVPMDRPSQIFGPDNTASGHAWILEKSDGGRWQMWGAGERAEMNKAELIDLPLDPAGPVN